MSESDPVRQAGTEAVSTKGNGARPAESVGQRRWWQEAAIFSAIATLLGTFVLAANGYVRAEFQQENELHEIRKTYLDRALDPARNRAYRVSVLRFLVQTFESNDSMGRWAKEELEQLTPISDDAEFSDLTADEVNQCLDVLRDRGSLEPVDKPSDGLEEDNEPRTANSENRAGGECCITCQGLTICGAYVETDCGSCRA